MRAAPLFALALALFGCRPVQVATEPGPPPPTLADLDAAALAPVELLPEVVAPSVLLRGATVMTATGAVYGPGHVWLEDGRIRAVGAGPGEAAEGVTVLDLPGRFLTPGLIDTHSHLGVYAAPGGHARSDGNEATGPNTGGVWAEHSVWPQDPGFQRALAGGVTALQILPGSANLVGGRGVVLQNVPARGSRAMRFPGAPETVKMACGENPKRVYGGRSSAPSTRMGNVRGHRNAFLAAQRYADEWERWRARAAEDPEAQPPARNLDHESVAAVLSGRALAQVHCYQADDMLSFLQLAQEFGFAVRSFHHALEAWKIRDILAERDVSVSTWADWYAFKQEAWDAIPENAALIHAEGGRAIIHSDSPEGIQRLNQETAKALAAGRQMGLEISDDEALQWITAHAAWTLGIEQLTGSLQTGLRGDVVVWSGHPFSVYSRPQLVFVEGALRYDRDRPGPAWSDFEAGVWP